MTNRNKNYF